MEKRLPFVWEDVGFCKCNCLSWNEDKIKEKNVKWQQKKYRWEEGGILNWEVIEKRLNAQ